MSNNVTGGLVLILAAAGLLYAWWSGALSVFLDQFADRTANAARGRRGTPIPKE